MIYKSVFLLVLFILPMFSMARTGLGWSQDPHDQMESRNTLVSHQCCLVSALAGKQHESQLSTELRTDTIADTGGSTTMLNTNKPVTALINSILHKHIMSISL